MSGSEGGPLALITVEAKILVLNKCVGSARAGKHDCLIYVYIFRCKTTPYISAVMVSYPMQLNTNSPLASYSRPTLPDF